MFALKPISHESVAGALARVERYRLLNEPHEAESICRDILEVEPDNQQALIMLTLTLTDQIREEAAAFSRALTVIRQLAAPYDREYYTGVAWERRAKACYHTKGHASARNVYVWLVEALKHFEEAEHMRPAGNDDAVLRWNACIRFLQSHKDLQDTVEERPQPILSE
jgi:hypothetical protein